jgi:pimeloyl-ACP methyl ester carboxylesterase
MSITNMTCGFFTQPLNHFVPRGRSPSYQQRYCVFNEYAKTEGLKSSYSETAPILFYTGNESPIEQYINQTGLMWEMAPQLMARVVFVEHRYEGLSLPKNLSQDCLSYASTIQALADYARILEVKLNPHQSAPVIAFGGSYGGMLTAWFRMKYPHLVEGAIAASAPIGAFPQIANYKIDGSSRVLMHGLQQPYPPTATKSTTIAYERAMRINLAMDSDHNKNNSNTIDPATLAITSASSKSSETANHCPNNLLAAWPLIKWIARQQDQQNDEEAKKLLQTSFSLCEPLPDGKAEEAALSLIRWAQSVWFDLGEGSFPFPSHYITFALLHTKVDLPAWPLQAACWNHSQLHADWGVTIRSTTTTITPSFGDRNTDENSDTTTTTTADAADSHDVSYDIFYGDSGIVLHIDWDEVILTSKGGNVTSSDISGLLTSVRDAVSIWYNITKDVKCYNISEPAPNLHNRRRLLRTSNHHSWPFSGGGIETDSQFPPSIHNEVLDPAKVCYDQMKKVGSWEPLCCNDEMNLVITLAQGLGKDFFWPPSQNKGVKTYQDAIRNVTPEPCPDPDGIFGYSKEPYELMSTRLDTYYGGTNMDSHSNIIFSNGLLDPCKSMLSIFVCGGSISTVLLDQEASHVSCSR